MLYSLKEEYDSIDDSVMLYKGRACGTSECMSNHIYLHPYQYEAVKLMQHRQYGKTRTLCNIMQQLIEYARLPNRSYKVYTPQAIENSIRGLSADAIYIDEVWPLPNENSFSISNEEQTPVSKSKPQKEWLSRRIKNTLAKGWSYNAN